MRTTLLERIYRAKRECDNQWIEGFFAIVRGTSFISDCDGFANAVIPETVCRYIELSDKDGKKIFEGDIVETAEGIGYINYEAGCFNVRIIGSTNNIAIDILLYRGELKVIGNLWDTPDFLGGGTDE